MTEGVAAAYIQEVVAGTLSEAGSAAQFLGF